MKEELINLLKDPLFGICLTLIAYLIGMWIYKKSSNFFILQPVLIAIVIGILVLSLISMYTSHHVEWVYKSLYKPGGDMIFWFLLPATLSFAVPLYKRNDIIKKYWWEILLSLFIGMIISLFGMYYIGKMLGIDDTGIASILPHAATLAVAIPNAEAINGNPSITAVACILNGIIVYAIGTQLLKLFKLKNPVGVGLGLGTSGTMGSAKAAEIGSIELATSSISIVIISILIDFLIPFFAKLMNLG
ncbi:antiholin LrgB [Lactobacillus sp. S2-2]|nr:LrgB family protein [Lactobacillus sp. S2-2]MCF6515677.1 antiholin LrgB [Lactobacillus sp. S2-2]